MTSLPGVPLTLEGSSVLHQMMRFRWTAWKALSPDRQDTVLAEAAAALGAMPQSAVGARFELALAAKANCRYPADFFPSDEVLARDLAEPLRPARDPADGVLRVPLWTTPGIGVEPDPACLEQSTLQQASLRG